MRTSPTARAPRRYRSNCRRLVLWRHRARERSRRGWRRLRCVRQLLRFGYEARSAARRHRRATPRAFAGRAGRRDRRHHGYRTPSLLIDAGAAGGRRHFGCVRQRRSRCDHARCSGDRTHFCWPSLHFSRYPDEPQRRTVLARTALDSRRASTPRCVRFAPSAASRSSSRAARVRTCGTRTASGMSTM